MKQFTAYRRLLAGGCLVLISLGAMYSRTFILVSPHLLYASAILLFLYGTTQLAANFAGKQVSKIMQWMGVVGLACFMLLLGSQLTGLRYAEVFLVIGLFMMGYSEWQLMKTRKAKPKKA